MILEQIPEAERKALKSRSPSPPPAASIILQTLVAEVCFNLELQHATAQPKITEVVNKMIADSEGKKETIEVPQIPVAFPLALDTNALLYVIDVLLSRVPGMGALTTRPPLALQTTEASSTNF